jgi:hypothetical protein
LGYLFLEQAMRADAIVLGLALGLAACATNSPPVPVRGDVARLEGQWLGSYENVMLARSGSIDFVLGPGVDTAQGSVLMIPEGRDNRVHGTRWMESNTIPPSPTLLEILFVRVDGHRVTGRLAAYRDPESGAMVTTTFSGYLEGEVIEGKFFTREVNAEWAVEGRWRVTRKH